MKTSSGRQVWTAAIGWVKRRSRGWAARRRMRRKRTVPLSKVCH